MLQTPLRTYTGWESGETRIPGMLIVTMGLLIERDERITKEIIDKIMARVDKTYPNGIPSERIREE